VKSLTQSRFGAGAELAVHLVQRAGGLVGIVVHLLAADDALNAHVLHQPRHRASGDIEAFSRRIWCQTLRTP
jgi:hypothetical protein